MPAEQQTHLAAYLVHLHHVRDPQFKNEAARRIEDPEAGQWISIDQLKEHWKE